MENIKQWFCVIMVSVFCVGCTDEDNVHQENSTEKKSVESPVLPPVKISNPVRLPAWFPPLEEAKEAHLETRQQWEDLFSLEILYQGETKDQMITRPHLLFDDRDYPIVMWEEENTFSTHIDNRQIIVRYNNLALTRWNGKTWVQMNEKTPGAERITNFNREQYPDYWQKVAQIQIESIKAQQMRNFASRIPDRKVVSVMDYRKLGGHWIDDRLIIIWKGQRGLFTTQWNGTEWTQMNGHTTGVELITEFRTENEAVMESMRFKFAFNGSGNPYLVWREPLEPFKGGFHEAKDNIEKDGIFLIRHNGETWTHADGQTKGAELVSEQKLITYVLPSIFFSPEGDVILAWVNGDTLLDTGKEDQASQLVVTQWNGEVWGKVNKTLGKDVFKPSKGMIYYEDFGVFYSPEGYTIIEFYSYTLEPFEKIKEKYVWDDTVGMWVKFTVVDEEGNEVN